MPDTETTDFTAEMIAGARDFQAGWIAADRQVVVVLSPESADVVARALVRVSTTEEHPFGESRWTHAAIAMMIAAAHADLPRPATVQLVPKVDLPTSAADLDARDQANVVPSPAPTVPVVVGARDGIVEVRTMHQFVNDEPGQRMTAAEFEARAGEFGTVRGGACSCGEIHQLDESGGFAVPADGRMHGLVEPW